uniref:cAMP-dependent protein kinase type II regulatory subunit n=1 Tax=Lygus hesperus TaxID=30085 RepID=A0A0A9Z103_LYGHE
MDQIKKCLSPDLHGLLYKFVFKYIEDSHSNFEGFGLRFFEDESETRRKPPCPDNSITKEALQMLCADPGALYKLVDCDPDILHLRDKLKFLVLGYLMDNPEDLAGYGWDYFKRNYDDGAAASQDSLSRQEVSATSSRDKGPIVQMAYLNRKSSAEIGKLRGKVQKSLLFRSLDDRQLDDVLDAMFKLEVPKDSCVIKQGDDGDYFYVVENGVFEAYVRDEDGLDLKVSTYRGNGSFGELSLLYNMPRVATVRAVTEGALWCLDRDTFRRIVTQSALRKRKMYEQLIASVPMLSQLNEYEKQSLADAMQPMTFEDGECVIQQSSEASGMYFVEEGTIIFSHIDVSGRRTRLSKIGRGGYFGELALLTRKARAVSAHASGRVRLAFVDRESFERILGPCKEIMKTNIALYQDQLARITPEKTVGR